MSVTTLPIWQASVSLPAKLTYMAWHADLPITDDSLRRTLVKLRQPHEVTVIGCVRELTASGWIG